MENQKWEKAGPIALTTDSITNVAEVVFIMSHELAGSFDIAVEQFVVEETIHCHHH